MAQLILAAAGAAVGSMVGQPALGWAIGSALGSMMAGPKRVQGPEQPLMDLRITGTEYGQPIPYVLGEDGIAGQLWWNTDRRPTTTTTTTESGGKGGGGTETTTSTTTYDMDVWIGLTDNEIVGISRIWNNGKLIWTAATISAPESDSSGLWTRLTVYTGAADQLPDPTYEAAVGTAHAPAYRGRGSVFIEGLKLGTSGQLPNLTFEVITGGALGDIAMAPFATFDPAHLGPHATLSNGNLTITADGTSYVGGSRATQFRTHDGRKWKCQFTIDAAGGEICIGIVNGSHTLDHVIGNYDYNGMGYYSYPGYGDVRFYNILFPTWAYNGVGNVVTMEFDGTDANPNNVWLKFWLNGSQVPLTWPVGMTLSMYGDDWFPAVTVSSGAQVTANFGASAFADPPSLSGDFGYGTIGSAITSAPPTVGDAVYELCLRAGLTAGQIDVTALSSITRTVRCLALSQVAATRAALELLMSTYFFELTVSDKIYFRPRGGASVASIAYLELGASKDDSQPEPLALKQANELEIPAQIALTYINITDDYQTDTQYSDRLISAASGTVSAVQMAIGMTPAEAKAVADTMLLDQAASAVGTTLSLLADYCRLEPTDPVTVTGADGSSFRLRLVKKTDSYPLLTFEAVLDDTSVLASQGITSADYTSSTTVAPPVNTLMELMDIPILKDADNDAGFYCAVKGDGTPYPGSAVFSSADDVTYTRKATVLESAVFGICTTTLGDWTGPRVFDETNSVTVNIGEGTTGSTTRDTILNDMGVNAWLIGSEIVQARIATLVSAGVYTLTGLLRGGRGTEWAMTGHGASERCVLLRNAGLRRILLENSELGLSKHYKGVTLGRALSTASSQSFTDNAVGLKPFSPFDLRAARDASNNITFTWQRRTRLGVRMIGTLGISVPLGEDLESYQLDVCAYGGYGTVVRTIAAATPTALYSAADQTADGLTPGNLVYVTVRQISATVGRGYQLEAIA